MTTPRLAGRIAIVSGAAGGIGAATVRLFCEEGAKVVAVDLSSESLNPMRDAICKDLPEAEISVIQCDLGSEASARLVAERSLDTFGAIDALVNLAGVRAYQTLADASAQSWDQILRVNLLGYAYMARECLPALRASRGAIVNVSSTHAVNPRQGMGQYDVTKAGIVSMSRTLAFEEAVHGVRVNTVSPGLTLTPFHVERLGRQRDEILAEDTAYNMQRRWADPREVAYPILWLVSREASFITGANLMVDGGQRT